MQENVTSPRDRGKSSVWDDIHNAALSIAEAEGLTAATIDRISQDANISRRTFFNYFPTKEAAVLGIRQGQISDETLAEFNSSTEDKLTRTVSLLAHVYRSTRAVQKSPTKRMDIFEKFPQLIGDYLQMNKDVAKLVEPVVQPLFATDGETGADEARILVATANAILVSEYKKNPITAFSDDGKFITSAINTFRKAMRHSL